MVEDAEKMLQDRNMRMDEEGYLNESFESDDVDNDRESNDDELENGMKAEFKRADACLPKYQNFMAESVSPVWLRFRG